MPACRRMGFAGKSVGVNLSLGNAGFQTIPIDPRPLLSS